MREERQYYVYIMTNQRNTVLYTGVTNNLLNRKNQHSVKLNSNSFTAKYNINKLVYYEIYSDIGSAIFREKQIKNYSRNNKIKMINSMNNIWRDLIKDFY